MTGARRFGTVLWKEWRGIRPFLILLVLLFLFGLFLVQFTEYMDEQPIWENLIAMGNWNSVVTFVLCLIVSLGLLTREKDEGNLPFLDGLPVSRLTIYTAKWLLAFLLIAGIDLLWTAESLLYEYLSKESDSPGTPWNHIAVFTFLSIFLCAFFPSVLFPLSFLRLWSLLVLGLVYFLLIYLRAKHFPFVTWFDPFQLIQPPASADDPWMIPWKHIAVLSAIGISSWIVGIAIFCRREGSNGFLARNRDAWLLRLAAMAGFLMIPIIWLSLIFYAASLHDGETEYAEPVKGSDIRPPPKKKNQIVSQETKRFQFVYRKRDADRIRPLAREADRIYKVVADFLRAGPLESAGKIQVDLVNAVGSHNAGQAHWNKIRMILPKGNSKATRREAEAILGHETAHVLMSRITDGRLDESFPSTRWFHEGLASYIEYRYFRKPGASLHYERWTALASNWGEVHFSELVSNGVLAKKRDPHLVYPAGLIWVEAAVDVYGEELPSKLLWAIGRPGGPRKLSGMTLWRDACLAAGYDLERIRSRYRAKLRKLQEREAGILEQFLEIKEVEVKREGGKIIIKPIPPGESRLKPTSNAKLICRVRPDAESMDGQWSYSQIDPKSGEFSVSALHFLKPKIGVQIGWQIKDWSGNQPIFGEWIEKNAARQEAEGK